MEYQFRMAPEIGQWAARLTAPLRSAWRGRPDIEARRTLGKIGFWIAQAGLDAAYQRQLAALQRSRRDVAEVATAARRLELQIAELERRAGEPHQPGPPGYRRRPGRHLRPGQHRAGRRAAPPASRACGPGESGRPRPASG